MLASPSILSTNQPDKRRPAIQATRPGRTGRANLVRRRLTNTLDREAARRERRQCARDETVARGRDAIEAVPLHRCNQELQGTGLRDEAGKAVGDCCVPTNDTPEQRAPGQADGDHVGETLELGGWRFGGSDNESGVRQATLPGGSGGTSRRLDHRRGIGVQTEDEGCRLPGCRGEHRTAVTGPGIDRYPLVAGNEICDLTDVHLDEATPDDETNHAREDTRTSWRGETGAGPP